MRRFVLTLLLLAACAPLPSPPPPDPAMARFEAAWGQARPWADMAPLLRQAYGMPEGDTDELLLSAMLWPEHSEMHPGLTPHPAWAEELGQARQREVAHGMAAWRQRAITDRPWIIELPLLRSEPGGFEFRMPLKPGRHLWMPIPLGSEPWVDRGADYGRLAVTSTLPATRVRVVFSLDAAPQPTQVYRHGDEITVASWGVALRLRALQLRDAEGSPLAHWFAAAE